MSPRDETFLYMLRSTFCPTFTWYRFITIITIVDALVFVAAFVIACANPDLTPSLSAYTFLGPNTRFFRQVDKWPIKMHEGQIWRFFTPIFFHLGFSHFINNCLGQLIWGLLLEGMVGFYQTAACYMVSGVAGNLFSAMCDHTSTSVGASTSINGLMSGLLAMVLANWEAFKGP